MSGPLDNVISVRFDIDTEKCLRDGVPALLKLAAGRDLRFSFFSNMGRAVSYAHLDSVSRGSVTAAKMTARKRLGFRDYLRTALFNPQVGRRHARWLRAAEAEGHEVGLHGGRNHGEWMRAAGSWSAERVADEVAWGMQALDDAGVATVRGFSSPGWRGSRHLPGVLRAHGVDFIADDHGPGAGGVVGRSEGVVRVATNLTGHPGGIGYLEHLAASGLDAVGAAASFRRSIESVPGPHVVYDHPCFAGAAGIPLLEHVLDAAQAAGFRFVTLADLVNECG